MTVIHLTDAQRDTFAACGIIVIDPELVWPDDPRYDPAAGYFPQEVAPEGWRILTEPCDMCDGRGQRKWARTRRGGHPLTEPCPDCVAGRRVVTLTATCPHDDGDISTTGDICDVCGSTEPGVAELGRFTIPALLPVVTHHIKGWHVYVSGGGRAYIVEPNERQTLLSLDPLPRPGQFIARPERVQ